MEAFKLMAEAAELVGVRVERKLNGFSGDGYVSGFGKEGDQVTFTVIAPESGHYRLTVVAAAGAGKGARWNGLLVDGIKAGDIRTGDSGSFESSVYPRVYLTAGEHKIAVAKGWGGIHVDSLIVEPAPPADRSRFRVKPVLVNPQACDCAKRLMHYLTDCYGTKLIAGQQASGLHPAELDVIRQATGALPAVRGFDFMDYSPSRVENGTAPVDTDAAIGWWEQGGIVTFCWHWNAPKDLINEAPDKMWYSGFYSRATTFDIAKAMGDETSEDYALLLRDIDTIAGELGKLRDHGVPVLWRPLHEASGGWFWWGAKGPEPCIKLWRLMYDRMTNVHGLNNLIWVWNGQAREWYPGDDVVDMVGEDIYGGPRAYGSQYGRFADALACTSANKIVALTENGTIPDPDELERDEAHWSWFCTWCGTFVYKEEDGAKVYSDEHTELDMLRKVYKHPNVVTLSGLPDLKTYPLPAEDGGE